MNNAISLPIEQRQPSVLTPDCIRRIGLLNNVARELKQQGFVLGQQEILPVRWSKRPAVEIRRDLSVSIMHIVCRAEQTWFDQGRGYAIYRGVTVWWKQDEN